MSNDLTCVILAGGLGTRLTPVVHEVPKPMAQVAGRPFLAYLVDQVRAAGCTDVVFCIGYMGYMIEEYFADGSQYGLRFHYSHEQQLLGTAGALALARPLIRSNPCVVLNGDSYCPVNLADLLAYHRMRQAHATIATTQVPDTTRYGYLEVGLDDAILHFREKAQTAGAGYVNAGIYALQLAVLDLIPPAVSCSIEQDLFPRLAGYGLYAFRQVEPFIDIGTPASFATAQIMLPTLAQRRINADS